MRELNRNELLAVSGGCEIEGECDAPILINRRKGNNGFGNGADDPNLAAPGNSGATGGGKDGSVGDDRGAR